MKKIKAKDILNLGDNDLLSMFNDLKKQIFHSNLFNTKSHMMKAIRRSIAVIKTVMSQRKATSIK